MTDPHRMVDGEVVFLTPEEIAQIEAGDPNDTEDQWSNVRSQRNASLQACDWTQLSDVQLTQNEVLDWASYRQALRDITDQSDPFNIIWPTPPKDG